MYLADDGARDAPPVLLLHGGGVAGWMWRSLVQRLHDDHRMLVPDLPGHGRSADQPYVSHASTVAELARALVDIGRPAAVVGFSLGAQLGIRLASEHPDLVGRAIIVSAQARPMRFTGLTLALLGATAPLARQRWFAELQARELFIPPELMDEYIRTSAGITRQTLLASAGANLRFELPDAWSRFPGRADVLVGRRERRLMRDSADIIHRALPGSTLTVVDDAGHGIPLQHPDWFDDRVAALLASG